MEDQCGEKSRSGYNPEHSGGVRGTQLEVISPAVKILASPSWPELATTPYRCMAKRALRESTEITSPQWIPIHNFQKPVVLLADASLKYRRTTGSLRTYGNGTISSEAAEGAEITPTLPYTPPAGGPDKLPTCFRRFCRT